VTPIYYITITTIFKGTRFTEKVSAHDLEIHTITRENQREKNLDSPILHKNLLHDSDPYRYEVVIFLIVIIKHSPN
jgi:hypothetical protein